MAEGGVPYAVVSFANSDFLGLPGACFPSTDVGDRPSSRWHMRRAAPLSVSQRSPQG